MSNFLGEVGRRDEPMRSATVLSVTNSRAKIELSTGAVIPSALLVGATYAGAHVRVAYQDGQYVVYGSGGSGMPSVSVGASSVGGTSVVGGTPSPHDWLGSHHTLPSGAAGLFAATPASSSGAVSMRAMALSDFQGAADTRYALQSTAITAGAGLTGNGTLGASFALAVGAGDGIAADTDAVRVRRATTSGLSFSSGGLAVGAGAGISVLTSTVAVDAGYAFAWSGVHTHSARPVFSAGATVAAGQTLRIGSGTGDVDLSRKASDVLALGSGDAMESTSYQSGVSGWRVGADGAAEFGNVRVRGEMTAAVFRVNEVSATAGTFGVYYSASVVHADFTTPAATNTTVSGVQIKNATPASTTALFASGDRLQVRVWNGTALVTAWFTVDAAPTTSTGFSTYTLRLQSGSTSAVVPAGTAIVDWGTASGGGAMTLSADGTIGAAPNISMQTTAGSPWSDAALRARIGNLNGSYGYSADTFGFAAGNSAATFVAVDSNNGFRVVRDTTTRFQVDAAGALTIRNAAGSAVITMDSTSARIDNVLNIGTSGEIRQGTGSLTASPATFTGTRMWNDSGVGRIGGYNSGALQWYAGTDGGFYCGGGDVALDSGGITVNASSANDGRRAYKFTGASVGNSHGMYSSLSGISSSLEILNVGSSASNRVLGSFQVRSYNNSTSADLTLEASNTSVNLLSGRRSTITIEAGTATIGGVIRLEAGRNAAAGQYQGSLYLQAESTFVSGGLNVGAATAATTGQLYMQGNSTKLVATNAQNGSAAFTLEYESGTTISRKGYLQFATNPSNPFNADLTFVSQSFGERVKFEGNTGNMLVHAGGNSNRPAAPRDTLHLNKQGAGAQTHGMTVSSNDTDVAEFFWSSSGAAIVQALNGNDSVLLQPSGTGRVRAAGLLTVEGDGTGAASTVGFSNVTNGVSTGNGTVKVNGTTARDSSGWLKIYVGTAVRYIPYWTTITG